MAGRPDESGLAGQPVASPASPAAIPEGLDMSSPSSSRNLDKVRVLEREEWSDGVPHELFAEMRGRCPVHWTDKTTEFPDEPGFWSVTTADDIHAVSRDWQTYSSEKRGITALGA